MFVRANLIIVIIIICREQNTAGRSKRFTAKQTKKNIGESLKEDVH